MAEAAINLTAGQKADRKLDMIFVNVGGSGMITFSRRSKTVFAKHSASTPPAPKPNPGVPTSRRDFWTVWPASGRTSPAGCVTSSRIL